MIVEDKPGYGAYGRGPPRRGAPGVVHQVVMDIFLLTDYLDLQEPPGATSKTVNVQI